MFIDAAQLTQNRAPSDASSVAFQVAIKQQKEFEEALKRAQDRREAEAAAERAQAEAQKEAARVEAVTLEDTSSANLGSGTGGNSTEAPNISEINVIIDPISRVETPDTPCPIVQPRDNTPPIPMRTAPIKCLKKSCLLANHSILRLLLINE